MRIESIKIENFRSFKDETILLDNYNCLIGPNGSGKSTVLNALNVFFRQNKDCKTDMSNLNEEDFHHKNTKEPIRITVTFTGLTDAAKRDLADYVRQDKLIISAVAEYDSARGYAEVKQYGNRLVFDEFREYFKADGDKAKVDELKRIYGAIKSNFNDLPNASTKPAMESALREYEAKYPEKWSLLPSEDQFYGISRGVNRLSPHLQWVFVSASKDITEECEESKDTALGQLLSRTVRSKVNFTEKINELKGKTIKEYQSILNSEQSALNEISESLKSRLESWSHPGISAQVLWKQDSETSVKVEEPWAYIKLGERGFEGDLARFGLGLQRSYLLALLQELTFLPDESAPTLIMGIEEPEIYQHPPQVRYLAETLIDLTEKNSQIIVCSHHQLFIPGDNVEAIRVVREKGSPSESKISKVKYTDLAATLEKAGQKPLKESGMLAKLYPTLNPIINEMFFCNVLILTEGIEDVAFLSTYMMLTKNYSSFRKCGCHFVPVGGKSEIIKPLAMAKILGIPCFVIFDADTDKTKPTEIDQHKLENKIIQELLDCPKADEWPNDNIFGENFAIWKTKFADVIKGEFKDKWDKYKCQAEKYYGHAGELNKNPLLIARTLETAWTDEVVSPVLSKLCKDIVNYAQCNYK
jgi:putative ATP-dependent endonuclease of the OLD family